MYAIRSYYACRDHAEPRVWRHLDTCQFKTFLHARIPRVDCPEHGVVQVKVPWAESKGRRITSYNVCYTKLLRLQFKCPYIATDGSLPQTTYDPYGTEEPFGSSRFYKYRALDGGRRYELGANFEISPISFVKDANNTSYNFV